MYLAHPNIESMNYRNFLALVAVLLICVACPKDDDGVITVPPRDRGEQAEDDDELIVEYLSTHFYNYEEFENPLENFDYQIRFDTIAGDNSDKIPLINRQELRDTIYSRFDTPQKLYILEVRQGSSEKPPSTYADSVLSEIKGFNLNGSTFENVPNPVWFDLANVFVSGFQIGLSGFKGAGSGPIVNSDGTSTYENFGIGAVFIPSGLAYYNIPQSGIPPYSSLVFTFSVYDVEITDHDGDGILSIDEDLNENGFLFDEDEDNTDGDVAFNFQDPDDDNDRVLTNLEIIIDISGTVTFLDTDGDGVFNHLDTDDDGDGIPTIEEIVINQTTGAISYPDTDDDGIADYLDSDS